MDWTWFFSRVRWRTMWARRATWRRSAWVWSSGSRTGASRSAVYTDELHRTADGWRIAHCRCRFIVADGLADRPDRQEVT